MEVFFELNTRSREIACTIPVKFVRFRDCNGNGVGVRAGSPHPTRPMNDGLETEETETDSDAGACGVPGETSGPAAALTR